MNIGERIAQYRKARGMTQKELADRIGTVKQTIGNYERGEREPTIAMVGKIAEILGVSKATLFGVQNADDAQSPGETLTNYMVLNGDTSAALALILGLSIEDIQRICADDLTLTIGQAETIAARYGTTPGKFLPDYKPTLTSPTEAPISDDYTPEERALIRDFRSLNAQGKAYILQTMAMSVTIYKNEDHDISDVEIRA